MGPEVGGGRNDQGGRQGWTWRRVQISFQRVVGSMELFREGRDMITCALILKDDPGFLVNRHGGQDIKDMGRQV